MRYVKSSFRFSLFLLSAIAVGTAGSASSVHAQGASQQPARPAPSQQPEAAGEVVSVDGTVLIRMDGTSASAPKFAKPGDTVFAGNVINTSSNGRIKVLMKDKSVVDLGPSALFKLDGFNKGTGTDRQVDVTMMYGTLRAAVTQKLTGSGRFKVKTPSATMGVRGTEFVVRSDVQSLEQVKHAIANPERKPSTTGGSEGPKTDGAQTQVTVLQGKVDVAAPHDDAPKGRSPSAEAPKVVSLTAGTQLIAQQGATMPKQPVTLDSKQLGEISSQARVVDNTFVKAVSIDPVGDSGSSGPAKDGRGPASQGAPPSIFSSSGAANVTTSVLASAVSTTIIAPPPISMHEMGIAGTFGGNRPPPPAPVQPPTGNRKLHIVITK